jgi:nucleoid-associated protein YgaU
MIPVPCMDPHDEGIASELDFLRELLEMGQSCAMTTLSKEGWVRDCMEESLPRKRYKAMAPALVRVAAMGLATFPSAIAPAPSFANQPHPTNHMIAMAERPGAPPGMGAMGLHLFPFSRPPRTNFIPPPAAQEPAPDMASPEPEPGVSQPSKAVFGRKRLLTLTNKRQLGVTYYQVSKGDSLYTIASYLWGDGRRWRELVSANEGRLGKARLLLPGTRLVVPHRTVAAVAKAPLALAPQGRYYKVMAGDSLYTIALRHLGNSYKWHELFTLNESNLHGKTLIRPNQWLRLPALS